ncbi:hypothetical protein [Sphingomonas oryzagri]
MRLDDQLAARRLLYTAPLITAPAVMAIDIPALLAGQGLALGRYYIVVIENDDELAEFETFLAADRPALCPPDLLDRRAANRETTAISFFEFAPSEPGWPWILLCHWPSAYAWAAGNDPDAFARGAYTMEAFATREDFASALQSHVSVFGAHAEVRIIPPLSGASGRA